MITGFLSMNCTEIVSTLWKGPYGDTIVLSSTYEVLQYGTETSVSTGWSVYGIPATVAYQPWPIRYSPCNPYLSIPPQILTLNPHWQYCQHFFKACTTPLLSLQQKMGSFLSQQQLLLSKLSPRRTVLLPRRLFSKPLLPKHQRLEQSPHLKHNQRLEHKLQHLLREMVFWLNSSHLSVRLSILLSLQSARIQSQPTPRLPL
ncbi:hypothetical protein N431DRAFT_196157 [Stipitochalara longipes BDJ]|nr:hypothetical protein N431DRAFT_196157 [Stipitochalara longipes BDJ]